MERSLVFWKVGTSRGVWQDGRGNMYYFTQTLIIKNMLPFKDIIINNIVFVDI